MVPVFVSTTFLFQVFRAFIFTWAPCTGFFAFEDVSSTSALVLPLSCSSVSLLLMASSSASQTPSTFSYIVPGTFAPSVTLFPNGGVTGTPAAGPRWPWG